MLPNKEIEEKRACLDYTKLNQIAPFSTGRSASCGSGTLHEVSACNLSVMTTGDCEVVSVQSLFVCGCYRGARAGALCISGSVQQSICLVYHACSLISAALGSCQGDQLQSSMVVWNLSVEVLQV